MALLNREAYSIEKDKLIYDSGHPIDATTVQVSIASDSEGVIKRGQLLFVNSDGVYSIARADGDEASVIAAADTSYSADDTDIVVEAYISGTFNKSAIVTTDELKAADVETLRSKGIYLK
jgi:hypothetical protein